MVSLLLFSVLANVSWAGAEVIRKLTADKISSFEFFFNSAFWMSVFFELEGLGYILAAGGKIQFHSLSTMLPMGLLLGTYFLFFFLSLLGYKSNDLSVQDQGDNFSEILQPALLVVAYRVTGRISSFAGFMEWQYIGAILIAFLGGHLLTGTIGRERSGSGEGKGSGEEKKDPAGRGKLFALIFPTLFCVGELCETLGYGLYVDAEYGVGVSETEVFALFAIFQCFILAGLYLFYYIKHKKIFNPFRRGCFLYIAVGLLEVLGSTVYVYADEINTFVAAILTSIYPEAAIILSVLFLKEKMTGKKAAALVLITAAVILAVAA